MFVGIVAVFLLCLVSPYQDLVLRNMISGGHSAPLLATLFFIVIVVMNGMARVGFRISLDGRELAVVFCMLLVASGIPSMGLVDYLIPTLVAPFYYANSSNDWATHFHPHIPEWLVPSKDGSSKVILDFVNGGSSVPWEAWLPCLFWWSTFLLAFYLTMISLCSLFSHSWIHQERLNFPLMELPLSVFEERAHRPWKSGVFVAGLAVPLFIYSWNIIAHRYLIDLPGIPLGADLRRTFGSSFGVFNASIYPSLIGFFYFVPTTVTCGVWVVFLFMKLQRRAGAIFGTDMFSKGGQWYGGSSEIHQSMGAMIVLMLGWIFVARESLLEQFRAARRFESWAAWGFVGGLVYMCGFWWAAGLNLINGICYFGGLLFIGTALTRLVAQAGLPYVQSAFVPTDIMTTFAGTQILSLKDMALTGLHFPQAFDMAGFMMPSAFNSFRVADRLGISKRALFAIFGLAILVALPTSFYSFLSITYEYGGSSKTQGWFFQTSPTLPFKTFLSIAKHPKGIDWHGLSFVGVGGSITAGLQMLLRRFSGWPIHPLGYILAGTWAIQLSWFSCLLAWLIKVLIIRYGRGRAYQASAPFFLGLILGGFLTPGFWALIDFSTGSIGNPVSTFPP